MGGDHAVGAAHERREERRRGRVGAGRRDFPTVESAGEVARSAGAEASPYVVSVISARPRITACGGVSVAVEPMCPVDVLVVPGFAVSPGDDVEGLWRHGFRVGTRSRREAGAGTWGG